MIELSNTNHIHNTSELDHILLRDVQFFYGYLNDDVNLSQKDLASIIESTKIKMGGTHYQYYYKDAMRAVKLFDGDNVGIDFDWKGTLQHSYYITLLQHMYCPDAVKNFQDSLKDDAGIWLIDFEGNVFFRKGLGSQTVLNVSGGGYGHWDDYTQLAMYFIEPIEYGDTIVYEMPFVVNFAQVTPAHSNGDYWFKNYPHIVSHLCEYAQLLWLENDMCNITSRIPHFPDRRYFVGKDETQINDILMNDRNLAKLHNSNEIF